MFNTANEFSQYIETLSDEKGISYIDAILEYCKENYLEPEDISKLVSKSLKDKLEVDFQEANYLPKTATLDF